MKQAVFVQSTAKGTPYSPAVKVGGNYMFPDSFPLTRTRVRFLTLSMSRLAFAWSVFEI